MGHVTTGIGEFFYGGPLALDALTPRLSGTRCVLRPPELQPAQPRKHTGGRVKYRAGRRGQMDPAHGSRDGYSAKQQGYLNYSVVSPRVSSSNTATARS